jgi:hypothetical protein
MGKRTGRGERAGLGGGAWEAASSEVNGGVVKKTGKRRAGGLEVRFTPLEY